MADRGGGSTGNSSLDGAFLLQLLRNPPQSSSSSPSSSSSSSFHQQTLTHHGPAVGHFSPSPSSSHPPPGFHRDPRRAPPHSQQFSGSPPVFDHIPHRPHNSHYSASPPPSLGGGNSHSSASPPPPSFGGGARDFGGNSANINASRKVLGSRSQTQSNANGNSPESVTSYWHKSMQAPPHHHVVSSSSSSSGNSRSVDAQRQEVQQNVGRREVHGHGHGHGHGQSLLHRELMGRQPTAVGNGRGFLDEGDGLVGGRRGGCESGDDLAEELEELSVTEESSVGKRSNSSRAKEVRLDMYRGHYVSSQRVRIRRRETECRYDIDSLTPLFLSIYKSLIPASEEKQKQNQLLLSLAKLVNKEWPNAQLHLYGSCANSFGVSNSDIDICLAIDDNNTSKSDILLKLADILESNNLQNVQALTHARVPIVKMMDPVTGISCDICTNNLLAVANTKLLSDYAQIDGRLRQLAFIVKHWAKSRGVNETYRGTLSSYAYVLMCIHFLQMRKPAILPCLQGMEPTYAVTLDGTTCVYFDQVDRLHNFGAQNNESIARLVWNFFHYWAYCHDYMNDVISVRTGQIISKRSKDWTRRIGNDRHLICIEDPFETSHDLGRVVDKFSIKILREEFERAAYVLQYDRNPTVTLFEPYVPNPMPNGIQSD